jgi:ankyrin repeat protein
MPSDKDKENIAKLLRKVTAGELDDVIELLDDAEAGVDVNAQEPETWETPLHKAARAGHVEVAKALIEKKANANAECIKGHTCLHVACEVYAADETGDFCWEDMVGMGLYKLSSCTS